MRFAYAPDWLSDPAAPALSVSLRKRPEPFPPRQCRPFFEGLLPEGAQRDAVASALGVSRANEFRLLERLGGEVAGALALWPAGETPPRFEPAEAAPVLTDDELAALVASLDTRPFLAGTRGLRLSLAGAQSKLPVVLVDGRIGPPAPGQPGASRRRSDRPRGACPAREQTPGERWLGGKRSRGRRSAGYSCSASSARAPLRMFSRP